MRMVSDTCVLKLEGTRMNWLQCRFSYFIIFIRLRKHCSKTDRKILIQKILAAIIQIQKMFWNSTTLIFCLFFYMFFHFLFVYLFTCLFACFFSYLLINWLIDCIRMIKPKSTVQKFTIKACNFVYSRVSIECL